MSTITIELPDEVVPSAVSPGCNGCQPRLAAAIHWYSRGQISRQRGADRGMDRRSFILALVRVDAIQVSAWKNSRRRSRVSSKRVVNASPIFDGPD